MPNFLEQNVEGIGAALLTTGVVFLAVACWPGTATVSYLCVAIGAGGAGASCEAYAVGRAEGAHQERRREQRTRRAEASAVATSPSTAHIQQQETELAQLRARVNALEAQAGEQQAVSNELNKLGFFAGDEEGAASGYSPEQPLLMKKTN